MSAENDRDPVADQEFYQGYSVDDEDQPQGDGDSLVDNRGLAEPLDEGYSPPEKWTAGQGYGNTSLEEQQGETLDQRLAQEVPEADPYVDGVEPETVGGEVGSDRAGRLVELDEGSRSDTEKDLIADDIGIDGGGAAAEEAAVHVVDDHRE
ncbi:MAG: DUF5709 domain-containing protein [Actinomycetota bacterium]